MTHKLKSIRIKIETIKIKKLRTYNRKKGGGGIET